EARHPVGGVGRGVVFALNGSEIDGLSLAQGRFGAAARFEGELAHRALDGDAESDPLDGAPRDFPTHDGGHATVRVDERSAAVPGVDRGVRLQELRAVEVAQRADDAAGERESELLTGGGANRVDLGAHPLRLEVETEAGRGTSRIDDLQQGRIDVA